jgi:CPW-WPC domain-containing protein
MTNLMNLVESKLPPADNQGALEAMTKQGLEEAESQASAAEQDGVVAQVVSTIVNARLGTFVYTGMCVRNYTEPCPVGWKKEEPEGGEGPISCSPEEVSETVGCQPYNVTEGFTAVVKESFSIKCKVHWPCAACKRDFSNCPVSFELTEEGLCGPTSSYVGPCPENIDFKQITDTVLKARWAARCLTQWPCIRE